MKKDEKSSSPPKGPGWLFFEKKKKESESNASPINSPVKKPKEIPKHLIMVRILSLELFLAFTLLCLQISWRYYQNFAILRASNSPFIQADVVFVISGIQNPTRSQLREMMSEVTTWKYLFELWCRWGPLICKIGHLKLLIWYVITLVRPNSYKCKKQGEKSWKGSSIIKPFGGHIRISEVGEFPNINF